MRGEYNVPSGLPFSVSKAKRLHPLTVSRLKLLTSFRLWCATKWGALGGLIDHLVTST